MSSFVYCTFASNSPRQRSTRGCRTSSSGRMRGRFLFGLCFRNGLEKIKIGFRVSELFSLLDLQDSVFVGGKPHDEDRFTGHLNTN